MNKTLITALAAFAVSTSAFAGTDLVMLKNVDNAGYRTGFSFKVRDLNIGKLPFTVRALLLTDKEAVTNVFTYGESGKLSNGYVGPGLSYKFYDNGKWTLGADLGYTFNLKDLKSFESFRKGQLGFGISLGSKF